MGAFLLKRLANSILLVFVAASLAYILASLALNPRADFESRNPRPTVAVVDAKLDELNANNKKPVIERYGVWLKDIVTKGDFGLTINETPVNDEFGRRIMVSVRLLIIGEVIGVGLGLIVGAYGAVRQYGWFDQTSTIMSFLIMSIPVVLLAILLKQGAIWLNNEVGRSVIEFTGEYSQGKSGDVWNRIQHLILPTISLALGQIAYFSRYQRSAMLDVMGADFLRTAQAKGLRRSSALIKHGFRTALIPMTTFISFQFVLLFIGAVYTESVYSWHGMGEWTVTSITKNDINSTAAIVVFTGILVLIASLVADLFYAALDPRVRVR